MRDQIPPADSHGAPRVLTAVIDRIDGPIVVLGDDRGGGVCGEEERADGRRQQRRIGGR